MSEQDIRNFVELSVRLQREAAEMAEWTTEKPTKAGYYWIYTVPEWEDKPVVMIVEVVIMNSTISFNIPRDGAECEDIITPARTTHYMGVVVKPEHPKG